jgi:hypothetical protein
MRYVLDDLGYIEAFSCNPIICDNKTCSAYSGTTPEGYSSLQEWAQEANIRAYKIVDGNLTYDEARAAALEAEWTEEVISNPDIHSSEEVKTNKIWIDGKPVYRKCYRLSSMPTTSGKKFEHEVDDLDYIVELRGVMKRTYTNGAFSQLVFPYANSGGNMNISVQEKTLIEITTTIDRSTFNGVVIFEYTKTTD